MFKSFFNEFRAFALRGSMIDLAVGIILGIAFGGLVNSLAKDILLNLIAALGGKPDFGDLTFKIGKGVVKYGSFLTAGVNFVLVSVALFLVLRPLNRAKVYRECPYCTTEVDSQAKRCPSCTADLERAKVYRECPYCTTEINARATRCPSCTGHLEPSLSMGP
ncbi:MAG: large conductance mechanosensitive channel protein MscL [Actinomycetota bacterium]